MSYAVRSSIDVALWFHDRADTGGRHLSAQKLQRLLLLTQAGYAPQGLEIAFMPAIFVPSSMGPVDPNIFALFENGLPAMTRHPMSERADAHLNAVWNTYGTAGAEDLRATIDGNLSCMRLVAGNDSAVPKPSVPQNANDAPNKETHTVPPKPKQPVKPHIIKGQSERDSGKSDKGGSVLADLARDLQDMQKPKKKTAKSPISIGRKDVRKWHPHKRAD